MTDERAKRAVEDVMNHAIPVFSLDVEFFDDELESFHRLCAASIARRYADVLEENERLKKPKPFILDGRDMTQHWIDGGSTDVMRRLSKKYGQLEGRDAGSTAVVLENLADDFDLMAEHAVQLVAEIERQKEELKWRRSGHEIKVD